MQLNHLTTLAEAFAKHTDRSEATVSNLVVSHARLFKRLRDGKGCSVVTYNNVMAWFVRNWPDDLEWPSDIPRPDVVDAKRGAA